MQSGLAFDISFDVANGPKTAKLVAQLMGTLPPMRHLVIVLKLFLQQREMNEVGPGCNLYSARYGPCWGQDARQDGDRGHFWR